MLVLVALLLAACSAQFSGPCQNDITGVINGTVVLGAAIYNATAACGSPNPSSCQSSIAAVNSAIQNLTTVIQQLAKDCGSGQTSPQVLFACLVRSLRG